jgi:hypothetical protein
MPEPAAKSRGRSIKLAVGISLLIAALAIGVWQIMSIVGHGGTGAVDAFFSIDDGKTFFAAPSENLPPFPSGGGTAVAARVFTIDGGKTQFVGYLERYTEAGKVRARELMALAAAGKKSPGIDDVLNANTEIKRPGDAQWTKSNDPAAAAIRRVSAPGHPELPALPYAPVR